MRKNKRHRRGFVKFLAALMLVFSMSAALYLGWQAYIELSERKTGVSYYDELAGAFDTNAHGRAGLQQKRENSTEADVTPSATDAIMPSAVDSLIERNYKSEVDFEALRKTCPDVVGWIRLDDTNIDYPIVHGDDNVFYMNHLPNGVPNSAGSIMLDMTNEVDFSDTISILHGHHMRNGNMFGNLEKLTRDGYFRNHPYFHLFTPQGDYNCEVVAGWTASVRISGFPIRFEDEDSFRSFVETGRNNAVYASDTEVQWTDRFVLLSTCAYSFTNARFIVLAKIL